MAKFDVGDLVVLKSGSMRMVVEETDDEAVSTVWCNEGVIGRDRFAVALLNKWEHREDDRGARPRRDDRGGDDRGGYKGRGGGDRDDRGGGYKGNRDRDDRGGGYKGGDRDDKPRGKTGWDGKPREKKYFRKDD